MTKREELLIWVPLMLLMFLTLFALVGCGVEVKDPTADPNTLEYCALVKPGYHTWCVERWQARHCDGGGVCK